MSNLSELLPTGGGQNAVDFVASGTLSSGQTVVLKTDGTVTAISASANPPVVGTGVVFDDGVSYSNCVYDSINNKVVIAYADSSPSPFGRAVVGTVSGTSISFGTPVAFHSGSISYVGCAFDVNSGKIVISYTNGANSNYGTSIVGTVSGTSISFGTPAVFQSAYCLFNSVVYEPSAQKTVTLYRNIGNASYGTAIVGTVSGTSISFGTSAVFNSTTTNYPFGVYDSSSQKIIISYQNNGNSSYGTAIIGTVSGTSISFGSAVVFNSGFTARSSSAYDTENNKTVIAFADSNNPYVGKAIVGTVSGTSISFGSATVFTDQYDFNSIAYDSNNKNLLLIYRNVSNASKGEYRIGTVSGTNVTFGSSAVFQDSAISYTASVYDSTAQKVVIAYTATDGTAKVFSTGGTNSADFIGITAEAISDTATGAVNVYGGINEAQTGLTIGSDYYVQSDGSLSTTASSVKVGQAISATTINMMDLT